MDWQRAVQVQVSNPGEGLIGAGEIPLHPVPLIVRVLRSGLTASENKCHI